MLWSIAALIAISGFGLSIAAGYLKEDRRLFVNGSIITGCALGIFAIYCTAYWSISELFWRFGIIDFILPVFGIIALVMLPLAKEIIRAGWKIMKPKTIHKTEITMEEAIEVLRRKIEKEYREGWILPSDYEQLLQQLLAIRNAVEQYDWP